MTIDQTPSTSAHAGAAGRTEEASAKVDASAERKAFYHRVGMLVLLGSPLATRVMFEDEDDPRLLAMYDDIHRETPMHGYHEIKLAYTLISDRFGSDAYDQGFIDALYESGQSNNREAIRRSLGETMGRRALLENEKADTKKCEGVEAGLRWVLGLDGDDLPERYTNQASNT